MSSLFSVGCCERVGGVIQSVRTPACHAGGREFPSFHSGQASLVGPAILIQVSLANGDQQWTIGVCCG